MSVAAFFRDARVRGALAGDKSLCGGLLAEFFAAHGYGQCAPQQLLTLSDLAVRCGDQAVARDALDHVVKSGQAMHQAFYRLGRLALSQNDPAAAARHFHLGTEADAAFPFNWMGEARALRAQGMRDAALAPAERFMGFAVRPHAPADLAVLADLGDYLFEAGQRRRCQKFYACVVLHGAESVRDAVRLADILAGFNDHAAAQALLLDQQKRGRLDHWGQRELALSFSHTGQHASAVELAEACMLRDPLEAACATAYVDVLARAGDPAGMADALARHADRLGPDAALELRARSSIANDIAGAAGELEGKALAYQSRLYYLAYDLAYAALAVGHATLALQLAGQLAEAAPDDIAIKLLRVEICLRQQMWNAASGILAGLAAAEAAQPQVLLKRFELACFSNDAVADTLFVELDAMPAPNRQFRLPLFRYLAERHRWNDLVDRAVPWLDRGFNYRQIGYVLFRAAKYAHRHADMMDAIEAVAAWEDRPDLLRLHASLALDLATDLPALDLLAHDPAFGADTPARRILENRRSVLAAAARKAGRRAVLLCCDGNYLTAAIVALHSIMQSVTCRGLDTFIAVDDDVAALAGRAVAPFIEAGLAVTILPAAAIVPAGQRLSPAYGIFTSGHVLAPATYYRIYAARHILLQNCHDRLVYIDSDILLRGKLDPLFIADMNGHAVAARLEKPRPEVRRATALHGLADGRYFNTGVMLFDMQNDRLLPALDRAAAAIAAGTPLLFHDRCALNLGCRDDFGELAPIWNTPVTETTRLAELPADAVLMHFLDRPKPWSAAYGGEAGPLWSNAWAETAAFIGAALAVDLLELARE